MVQKWNVEPTAIWRETPDATLLLAERLQLLQFAQPFNMDALTDADLAQLAQLQVVYDTSTSRARFTVSEAASHLAAALATARPEMRVRCQGSSIVLNTNGEIFRFETTLREEMSQLGAIGNDLPAPIIWFGESIDGLHAGPIFYTPEDVRLYTEASSIWARHVTLRGHGFDSFPLSLVRRIQENVDSVVCSIVTLLQAPRGTCVLENGYRVRLWTYAPLERPTFNEARRTYAWSKGLFRSQSTETVEGGEAFISSCFAPSAGTSFYESNSGKGTDASEAALKACGESIERFAAYFGQPAATSHRRRSHVPLMDLHPLMRQDELHIEAETWCDAYSLHDGETWSVPFCMIGFPARGVRTFEEGRCTTTGLAGYVDREGAIERALLEVLERHSFYSNFLHLRHGERLVADDNIKLAEIHGLQKRLAEHGLDVVLFRYSSMDEDVPIVHAFTFDQSRHLVSRGSGSDSSWTTAARGAILESLQIRAQQLNTLDTGEKLPIAIDDRNDGFINWSKPVVYDVLRRYVDSFALRPLPTNGSSNVFAAALRAVRESGSNALAADLQSPCNDYWVVRVIVPGFCGHQQSSPSAGGRLLSRPAFSYGVPA